jgi:5-formyltetrahydrofolate cyclo-ligase
MMLASRRALPAEEAGQFGLMIQRAFIESVEFCNSCMVGLYAPVHNEVETAEVLATILASSRAAIYPAVNGDKLEFRRVDSPDKLQKGAFGIFEPDVTCEVIDPDRADLIVVPGIAFDEAGKRIGYGKGYYDRALHHLEGSGKLVGFCYDCQLVGEIAGEPHDVTMDLLITEKRVIRPLD